MLFLWLVASAGLSFAALDPRAILCVPTIAPCISNASTPGIWCIPEVRNNTNKYVVLMYQQNATDLHAAVCLGRSNVEKICIDLQNEGTFTCDNLWRSGMSGSAVRYESPDFVRSLRNAVSEMAVAVAGKCAGTLSVNVTSDTILLI